MSLQESSAETKSLPSAKKLQRLLKLPALVINQFFISKAPFFTLGLLVSYYFMLNSMKSLMMDYLEDTLKISVPIAVIITNLQDSLSCMSVLVVYLISEAYTRRFTMIAFCSSASTMGLMLFWISATGTSKLDYCMVYVAIFLITLGSSGESISNEFFDYQLDENWRAKKERKPEHEVTDNGRKEDLNTDNENRQRHIIICTTALWSFCVRLLGYTIVVILSIVVDDQYQSIRFGALLMVGSYLLFYFGYAWYSHGDLPPESNLGKIYRICKAAFKKRKFERPTSENGYFWKNYNRSNFYKTRKGEALLPRVPSLFTWLDKAAIIKEQSENYDLSPRKQEMKGELCTVKEVREMKSVAMLFCWGFTFFAYSLVGASGNSYFVAQASNLTHFLVNDISLLFVLRDIIRDISQGFCWLIDIAFKRIDAHATVIRISIGMVCAVICCVLAWRVEDHRLSLTEREGTDGDISMSTTALVPQFLLLGISEGLAEEGLNELFRSYASQSMRTFDESFSQLVIGIGKLLAMACNLIFSSWLVKESDNSIRHLDRYYLMLAVLNFVFLPLFAFYYFKYAYKNESPEDEEISPGDEEIAMEQGLLHAHQPCSEKADTREENNEQRLKKIKTF